MTFEYEVIQTQGYAPMLKRTDEAGNVAWIPMDGANSDYQAYLNKDKPKVEHLTEIPTV